METNDLILISNILNRLEAVVDSYFITTGTCTVQVEIKEDKTVYKVIVGSLFFYLGINKDYFEFRDSNNNLRFNGDTYSHFIEGLNFTIEETFRN